MKSEDLYDWSSDIYINEKRLVFSFMFTNTQKKRIPQNFASVD